MEVQREPWRGEGKANPGWKGGWCLGLPQISRGAQWLPSLLIIHVIKCSLACYGADSGCEGSSATGIQRDCGMKRH